MITDTILKALYIPYEALMNLLINNTSDVTLSSGFGSTITALAGLMSFINNFIPISSLGAALILIILIEAGIAIYKWINKAQKLLPGRGG